jgi:hypothetical protein
MNDVCSWNDKLSGANKFIVSNRAIYMALHGPAVRGNLHRLNTERNFFTIAKDLGTISYRVIAIK